HGDTDVLADSQGGRGTRESLRGTEVGIEVSVVDLHVWEEGHAVIAADRVEDIEHVVAVRVQEAEWIVVPDDDDAAALVIHRGGRHDLEARTGTVIDLCRGTPGRAGVG